MQSKDFKDKIEWTDDMKILVLLVNDRPIRIGELKCKACGEKFHAPIKNGKGTEICSLTCGI